VYNFGINGYNVAEYIQNIDPTNTINGRPMYYLNSVSDVVISPKSAYRDAGYIGIIDSDHITIKDMSISDNLQGILLVETTNTLIQGVELSNNQYGLYMSSCSANMITDNALKNNDWYGIYMYTSNSNNVTDNTITYNGQCGMYIQSSGSNLISGNSITDSTYGIYNYISSSNKLIMNTIESTSNGYGLYLVYSDSCIINGNTITGTRYGIYLMRSGTASLTCNTIVNNMYGIYIYYLSNDNKIFHNNIVENTYQVYSIYSTNTWDNGYPSGGNYFSDYTGEDANSDGIGDSPYIVDTSNKDNYPLMDRWGADDSIFELLEDIQSMELPSGLEDSLETKLSDTLDLISDEEYNAASNQLQAFINQIEAQRGKKLSEEQADQLIESTEVIIYMISTWI